MATFTVTTLADSGAGSLREAIDQANVMAGEDTIDIVVTGIIVLTEELKIQSDLKIRGTGITISGNDNSRVFNINNGNNTADISVTIDGLTIKDGFNPRGGGIFNRENTTLINSTITENTSKVDDDDTDVGGGILNSRGILNIYNSTISSNSASTGGGLHNLSGQITLSSSTISGNMATANGGGIYNTGGTAIITNSTISGNTATANGGGIYNYEGTAIITNSTISNNSAVSAGGVYNYIFSETNSLTITSTIIANSTGGDFVNVGTGAFTSSNNLVADGTDPNALSGDPNLSHLQNNGGTTLTHALLTGSPAIDAGSNPNNLTTDQRGELRLVGTGVDIGAYEASTPTPNPKLSINSVTVIDSTSLPSSAIFTVTLSAASATSVTVQYATQDGSAIAGADYTPVAGTLTFSPGQTTANITVPIIGDTLVEPDEVFFLNLSNATNAVITVAQGSATIFDFDPAQYGASYGDLIQAFGYDLNALTNHYFTFGINERRNPDQFDEDRYIASNTDLIASPMIVDPTTRLVNDSGAAEHYIRYGFGEGRSLNSFPSDQYIASYTDLINAFGYNLTAGSIHYVQYGIPGGRLPDTFDEYRYLAGYDDLLNVYGTNGTEATQHYIQFGSQPPDNRDPLAFKSDIYIASYGDLIQAVQPISDYATKLLFAGRHYVFSGRGEGRVKEIFNPTAYLAKNPDVAADPFYGNDPTRHYIEYGFFEGRMTM